MKLYDLTGMLVDLQDALAHDELTDEQRDEADALVAQILEGLLPEKVEGYCKLLAGLKAEAEAYTPEIKRLQARQVALLRNAEQLQERLFSSLSAAGVAKVKAGTFTVAIQASTPSVAVVDESAIPESYWQPQSPRLDKAAVLRALKAGDAVPGAELHQGTHLRIR